MDYIYWRVLNGISPGNSVGITAAIPKLVLKGVHQILRERGMFHGISNNEEAYYLRNL